ncbi:MAG TPA: hypothetical protein VIH92_07245 [Solirubrobacteraceae bacterium]
MAVGANGEVLAGEGHELGELDSLGQMRLTPLRAGGQILTLATGSDGRVWALLSDREVLQIAGSSPENILRLKARQME